MAYTKTTWADGENKYNITDQYGNILSSLGNVKLTNIGAVGTPISATNLNKIEQGIFDLDGNKISTSRIGAASGVCELDSGILIPTARLPVIPTANLTNSLASLDTITQQWELLASASIVNSTTPDVTFASLPSGYDAFRIIGRVANTTAPSNDNGFDVTMKINGIATGYNSVTKHSLIAPTTDATGTQWTFKRPLIGHSGTLEKGLIDIIVDGVPSNNNFQVTGKSVVYNAYGSGFDELAGYLNNTATRVTQIVLSSFYWDIYSTFKLYGAKKFAT